ncbi:hypothetical protein H7F51_06430 [Novosphingobium flavum]|uniref:Alpha/beta hydrolase n=1 Tax=Novosphingobium flavum TaxID=1778672 RepID=A0A7X1FQN1_9SPHN|nr:hypothetical protein [Novosphingobium flavum]MBC2665148.1 hypothetical protein [Novosphingobium flavum]
MNAILDRLFVLLSGELCWTAPLAVGLGLLALGCCGLVSARWRPGLLLVGLGIGGAALAPFLLAQARAPGSPGPYPVYRATVSGPIGFDLWLPARPGRAGAAIVSDCSGLDGLPLAAAEGEKRRIVLYMPHFKGARDDNSVRLRHLAAHGYIVAAFDDIGLDRPRRDADARQEQARLHDWLYASQADYDRTVALNDLRVGLQARKALAGLDWLAACAARPEASGWNGLVDHRAVAFMGFSFGGATAAEAAMIDPRVAAVISLDGSLFGRAAAGQMRAPYLYIRSNDAVPAMSDLTSGKPRDMFNARLMARHLQQQAALAARAGSAGIRITGTAHGSFSDALFEPHASRLWLLNDPNTTFDAADSYILDFLDGHLRGRPMTLIGRAGPRLPRVETLRGIGLVPGGNFGWRDPVPAGS